jgi:hypothetical protein
MSEHPIPRSGVHRFRSRRSSRSLCRALERQGIRCFLVDLHGVSDKRGLLAATASALGARGSASRNWDALEEALRDLAWARAGRYAIVVTGGRMVAATEPRSWSTALDILGSAVAAWAGRSVPVVVLIRGAPTAADAAAGRSVTPSRAAP